MARPRKVIDQKLFENLCGIQATLSEIADAFDCSEDTIERWCERTYKDDDGNPMRFAEVFRLKRGKGKISLRRMQWHLAERNAAMAIWLGKQYLDQKETSSQYISFEDDGAELQIYIPDNGRDRENI